MSLDTSSGVMPDSDADKSSDKREEKAQAGKGLIVVTAGGTGGHVFPALAVAAQFKREGYAVHWLGTSLGIEARLVPQHGIPLLTIDIKGLRGKGIVTKLLAPLKVLRATLQAVGALRRLKPLGVLGMGGYVTGPVGLAAWMLRCPLVIHEQNAIAGLTNRLLAKLSRLVLFAFPGAFEQPNALLTGNPIRQEIINLPSPDVRLGDRTGPIRLLIVGGSLGAKAINEGIPGAINALMAAELTVDVWHQCGQNHLELTRQAYGENQDRFKVEPFIDNMAAAYEWADLVICRAGALTVSEVAAAGVAAIFIPFPYAVDDHQTKNAQVLVKAGAAQLLPQTELKVERLVSMLSPLFNDRAQLLSMAQSARGMARCDATTEVAEKFLEVCTK